MNEQMTQKPTKNSTLPPFKIAMNKHVLDNVSTEHAYEILERLADEDVWNNSGNMRYEYIDPNELAFEMFEESLEPYIDDLRKCQKLSMDEEAKLHCMGILKGIDKFEREATTEFKDWAVDDPYENFIQVFEEWKKENKNPKNLEEMDEFITLKHFHTIWENFSL